eukprot:CAMPEP_0201542106 /NCGR_PEP_ID=MMETSP0161_2-20130828/71846_1 /ASSEMBLY_ACC=CAM_ASM_000251 /TAXON_ID=180227 /ORGANISM="Neoparamoeba aestuarina, Strain SoJaBio B1-5/56/2" /LENGTH=35 /DNA_ID= /DNA_START= /DNA_END= /DNA_ORIENTATION=
MKSTFCENFILNLIGFFLAQPPFLMYDIKKRRRKG